MFYLDRYLKGEKKCVLKSMDHNHKVEDESVVPAFQQAGLLPKE